MSEQQSLYHFADLYEALLTPDPEVHDHVEALARLYIGRPPRRVMDPACGPATWLKPQALKGRFVAGNDLHQPMIDAAAEALGELPCELTCGDMRALDFDAGDFDLVLNLHASVGHLPDDDAVLEHLRSVAAHMAPGGLFLLEAPFLEMQRANNRRRLLYEGPWTEVGQGRAKVTYWSTRRDPRNHREEIELELMTEDLPERPAHLVESYGLLTFTTERLQELAMAAGLEWLSAHDPGSDGWEMIDTEGACGDVVVALRRRGGRKTIA